MGVKPAGRIGDPHACPAHGPSPVLAPGCATVLINGRFAARATDIAVCPNGAPDAIVDGIVTVKIGSLPAARKDAQCAHGGAVSDGSPNVLIGNPASNPDGGPIDPDCAFLGTLLDGATGGILDRLRDSKTMSGPTEVTASPNGVPTKFRKYTTTIRGKQIEVYEPVSPAPGGQWTPSAAQVSDGLATLSDKQLANIDKVYITREPGAPASYAENDRTIRMHPRSKPQPQGNIDWALQHESGHSIPWGPNGEAEWQRAMADDDRLVTTYGGTKPGEDCSEAIVMYALTKGTKCEATARTLFPHRYALLDRMFPDGVTVRRPKSASKPF